MNKVYTHAPNEDWIVDRLVKEWNNDNHDIVTLTPNVADVVWLLADWCFDKFDIRFLASKKVLTTIHHIVPEKFKKQQFDEFMLRDSVTTAYHVANIHTQQFIQNLTKKPIHLIPYWANQNIWKPTSTKYELRNKYNIPQESYVIGSFQRDTEGNDLRSPKLEKGPDLLADYIEYLKGVHNKNIFVLLAGWRRQYLISRLNDIQVPYMYSERPSQKKINDLYQIIDLYPVTARYEGGPQSIIECGLLNIPVVSRNIGIASALLPVESVNDNISLAVPSIPDVKKHTLPMGYVPYRKLIESL